MSGNTVRGTPNRGQPRGQIPFQNSPAANSNIPRPVPDAHSHVGSELAPASSSTAPGPASSVSASRQKQTKRDEAIRRKLENDLSKKSKTTPSGRARHSRKAPPGTVLALKPTPALQIKPGTTVAEAAQLMAAKREDCVLVTDDDDRIAGIFTAKDLAFRVVGAGMKANTVTIAEIMTKNPLCARTDTSATDALDLMVRKGFRHLPVMDENQDISGILDITKCFYDAMEKLERAYSSSRKLYDALEGVQSELGASQPQQIIQYVEALRSKMSGPTLESVLNGLPPTTVSVRTSVKEAAQLMKDNHTTAVLVQDQGAITGIFTSKDVVLRVIAPGLDPANCSVVRVMTPHPDFAPMDMSIQAALRKMHDGHYLNLPVMNDGGEIVGMVDVLKLTYATLEQINTMSSGDSEGPAWNKFWLSLDHETESMMSGEGGSHSHNHGHHGAGSRIMSPELTRDSHGNNFHSRVDSVAPNDSASHVGMDSPPRSALGFGSGHNGTPLSPDINPAEVPFPFKFKAPSGRVHRLQVTAAQGIAIFVENVASKLGAAEYETIGGIPAVVEGKIVTAGTGFAISYLDDEGDSVSITADQDLLEAILLARQGHRDKVDLFVHDPAKPPAAPAATEHTVRRRNRSAREDESDDDSEDSDDSDKRAKSRRSRRRHGHGHGHSNSVSSVSKAFGAFAASNFGTGDGESLIQGVSNDLLLPGAIVTLSVVILGVFTITRLTR
ncbi:mitochondrial ribosomal protein subunit s4 [Ophiostoma piceae UAMH 11346]|uniref:Mitochondrial ribosomal protein subunit s4 n=1 Tax=Ophiostoma piceae (strain UAMH 11346) TaxID=1262450 RepID=S3BXB3_OPHP1|nr:mitochondrial ribosomal protein subunit s4 [Ophiostoma piceae UAMH 11346]